MASSIGVGLLSWGVACGWAFDLQPTVYLNADVCRASHALTDGECAQAYANAKAEFDEKAPKFPTRAACERHFRHCMIGDLAGDRRTMTFIPLMRGFRIESGRTRQALPVVEGREAETLFRPRAVNRVDSAVSATRSAEAQKTWKALSSAAIAGARPQGGAATPGYGDDEGEASGAIQSYPVPAPMLQDMLNRERLYGLGQKQ
ncbi:DUF1190 domain-containing protein [Roseiarcus fermentans]|uniref:DUF1190 domain-containing protein n=1 Tax=Roseiarcus fermentans TaxID=1473586 RepID=UPI0014763798|nr:DUF1190 domain-containing protein [Roseiarcus fermentans]